MVASLDRAVFYATVRLNPFPGHLTQGQVTGMDAILDACPPDYPTDFLAQVMGTCPIETAWTMLPIKETGGAAYYTRMYDITGSRPDKARELGNLTIGDGAKFCGRGLVQLTGRANYRKATLRLRALSLVPLMTDLEATPDFAMDPDVASLIDFIGQKEGWFTGKKLSDYFGPGRADWLNARRIINGTDRAAEIARHSQAFQAALLKAGHKPDAVSTSVPTPPVQVQPLPAPSLPEALSQIPAMPLPLPAPAPVQPTPQPGLFARMAERLRIAFPPKKG